MTAFTSILCAIDSSPLAPRVLRHAVGFAGVCGARLTVLTVTAADPREAEGKVSSILRSVLPPGAPYMAPPRIQVVHVALGRPADAILSRSREGMDLIVAGTHAKSGLSRWLLGSTSAAIMEEAMCPTLLVPPGDLDIVTLTADTASLHPGTVLAAVDLAEHNDRQLVLASQLASLARQPLALMTVAAAGTTDADAEAALWARGEALTPGQVERLIVRRGLVPDQIDQAAVAARAGLVVMGLRARGHGIAGELATAVLDTKDAVVLAVPAS